MLRLSQNEKTWVNGRWKILSSCRDFNSLIHNVNSEELDIFERQINEYLKMGEITERYLNEVPISVCWYEGLISTKILLIEIEELKII